MAKETCGGVLVENGKILLGKRRSDRLYPNIWDIFGGHIEPGESREETLRRELGEEIGISTTDFDFLESYQDKDPTYGNDYIHYIFLVRSWKGKPENRAPYEHETIKWFTRLQTQNLRMHDEVKRIIMEKVRP